MFLNIEDVPWQLTQINGMTEDEAYEIIGTLNWYPESINYAGIVCDNYQTAAMKYNYFSAVEEAIGHIIWNLQGSNCKYFLLRQMTETEVQAAIEREKYQRLLKEGQLDL